LFQIRKEHSELHVDRLFQTTTDPTGSTCETKNQKNWGFKPIFIFGLIWQGSVFMSSGWDIRDHHTLMHRIRCCFNSISKKKFLTLSYYTPPGGQGSKNFFFELKCSKIPTILRIRCWFRICMSRGLLFWSEKWPYRHVSFDIENRNREKNL
jgi:hypothetical protein